MTLDELKTQLLARAYWMRDKRHAHYLMLNNAHRWAETINSKRFRPYFDTTSKRCITLEQAKYLKECFYSVCNGLQ